MTGAHVPLYNPVATECCFQVYFLKNILTVVETEPGSCTCCGIYKLLSYSYSLKHNKHVVKKNTYLQIMVCFTKKDNKMLLNENVTGYLSKT